MKLDKSQKPGANPDQKSKGFEALPNEQHVSPDKQAALTPQGQFQANKLTTSPERQAQVPIGGYTSNNSYGGAYPAYTSNNSANSSVLATYVYGQHGNQAAPQPQIQTISQAQNIQTAYQQPVTTTIISQPQGQPYTYQPASYTTSTVTQVPQKVVTTQYATAPIANESNRVVVTASKTYATPTKENPLMSHLAQSQQQPVIQQGVVQRLN